ncbi:hypothetical protein [Acidovorax sp.]|uniref:hypothetical protein n=1 Tax=Acidovorax sp. TaxID=1872122 RepID=UPI0025C41894|nr:hypothetical protein [Acidovorax sp.]MBL7088004.1 hypothetical protein [Acidovorax sp.]
MVATSLLLAACQAPTGLSQGRQLGVGSDKARPQVQQSAARTGIDVPLAWGGQLRCGKEGCRLVAVEHEKSTVVLYEVQGRQARLLDRQPVAYHPDGAIWLADDLVVAAVEGSFSLDVFRVVQGRLQLLQQIPIGISPRDVVLVQGSEGRFRLLATPYSGKEVVWVDYAPDQPDATRVQRALWCEAPWHPVRVHRAPGAPYGGVVTACLDEKRVVFVPEGDLLGVARNLVAVPGEVRIVPRQTRPSPSGRWLYVALETGGRNLRFDMDSGELQWIAAPLLGTVSVLPLADDLVIWAADSRLYFQRLAGDGAVLETRWLPVDGFATGLQLVDADVDGVQDLVVYNSAALPKKMGVEIIYGPLWEQAQPNMP